MIPFEQFKKNLLNKLIKIQRFYPIHLGHCDRERESIYAFLKAISQNMNSKIYVPLFLSAFFKYSPFYRLTKSSKPISIVMQNIGFVW
jgi:hypothetical protein